MKRTILLAFAAFHLGQAAAQVPAVPQVPRALPGSVSPPLAAKQMQLERRRKIFLEEGALHNARCKGQDTSIDAQGCAQGRKRLGAELAALRKDVESLDDEIDAALAAERIRLQARDKELQRQIDVDATAVRNLGFDRRAADFEAWGKLSLDSQLEFQRTVSAEATSLAASYVKDGMISGVKKLDAAKVEGWVAVLAKQDPPPSEIIAVLRRMASIPDADRLKLATDAKYLATLIQDVAKSAPVTRWRDGLPVLLEIICDGVPQQTSKQCKGLKAIASSTAAALYNNAAQRVAEAEIERLTSLTEAQLGQLARLNRLLARHVEERREVSARLKELEQ